MNEEEKIEILKNLTPEDIAVARSKMTPDVLREFDDTIAILRARTDRKASLEYFMRNSKNGQKVKLTVIQQLILDFVDAAWSVPLIPIVNAPMGTGKSTLACGILADEIGHNQNFRTQVLCTAEDTAIERGELIAKMLLTSDYRRVFPHIERDKTKPWKASKINVKRTMLYDDEAIQIEKELGAEPGSINATMRAYGINSNVLGSRTERTILDDIPNEDNAINSKLEGEKISRKLDSTILSRKESPIGETDETYDPKKDPFRALFINTPWAEDDCVMQRINLPTYATILIGVNDDFTGYNVEIWNLPDEFCEQLKAKYSIAEGYHVYQQYKAKCLFTIPLSRPAYWYKKECLGNPRQFNQNYRCIVYSDQEKAFPQFDNCLDFTGAFRCVWQEVSTKRKGKDSVTGNRGFIANPPTGSLMYAAVDLSGVNRAGTVITVGLLLPNYQRFIIDIWKGAWSGDEISDIFTRVFIEHPQIQVMWVENQAQQDLWVKEIKKHCEVYPWWMKIREFVTTVKSKNDKMLGVLAMDTAFVNKGFRIAASISQEGHPPIGDPTYPKGCPCGFCQLIKDARNQLRLEKVAADTLMSLWMLHSSMPQFLEEPTAGAPEGYEMAATGADYADGLYYDHERALDNLNQMFSPDSVPEARICECSHKEDSHKAQPDGTFACQMKELDDNPCDCKDLKIEEVEDRASSPEDYNSPNSRIGGAWRSMFS